VDFGRRKKGFDPRLASGLETSLDEGCTVLRQRRRCNSPVCQSLPCAPVATDGSAIAASSAAWSPGASNVAMPIDGISKANRESERILQRQRRYRARKTQARVTDQAPQMIDTP
jgi:hypothetical protein